MRRDMERVIITPARHKSYVGPKNKKYGKSLRYDPEDDFSSEPKRVSAGRKQYSFASKDFSDLLGPLRRFLKKNVGRPWNKVWSEVCEQTDHRSVVGNHFRDHVKMEVEFEIEMVDGKPHATGTSLWRSGPHYTGFWVHPKTGILMYTKHRPHSKGWARAKALEELEWRVVISPLKEFRKHKGLWFVVWFDKGYKPDKMVMTDDKRYVATKELGITDGWEACIDRYKQASKREIAQMRQLADKARKRLKAS